VRNSSFISVPERFDATFNREAAMIHAGVEVFVAVMVALCASIIIVGSYLNKKRTVTDESIAQSRVYIEKVLSEMINKQKKEEATRGIFAEAAWNQEKDALKHYAHLCAERTERNINEKQEELAKAIAEIQLRLDSLEYDRQI
jgi:hypothetical protein